MRERNWVEGVAAEYRGGRPLALFFDFDGTLAPIVAHPRFAAVPDATRAALGGLGGLDRVTVGVLSGRALGHLRDLVGLPGAWYAGSGGMHLDCGGREVVGEALAGFDRVAEPVQIALSEPVRWFPGTWVERKPGCLSVHYRGLSPLKTACFKDEVRDALASLADDAPPLRVRDVSRALEISLSEAWTKGDAVDRMLADLPPTAFPFFAGDAANDDEAVGRVNAGGGLSVGVGPEPPAAVAVRVATTETFAADLARLLDALAGDRRAVPARSPLPDRPITFDSPDKVVPRPR